MMVHRFSVVFPPRNSMEPNEDIFKCLPNFYCSLCNAEMMIGGKTDPSDYIENGKSIPTKMICLKCDESVLPKRLGDKYAEEVSQ